MSGALVPSPADLQAVEQGPSRGSAGVGRRDPPELHVGLSIDGKHQATIAREFDEAHRGLVRTQRGPDCAGGELEERISRSPSGP